MGCHTHSIRLILLYKLWGDAMLTMGPYGSVGTCIKNYAPPEINHVVMTKALFDNVTLYHNQGCVTIDSVIVLRHQVNVVPATSNTR